MKGWKGTGREGINLIRSEKAKKQFMGRIWLTWLEGKYITRYHTKRLIGQPTWSWSNVLLGDIKPKWLEPSKANYYILPKDQIREGPNKDLPWDMV